MMMMMMMQLQCSHAVRNCWFISCHESTVHRQRSVSQTINNLMQCQKVSFFSNSGFRIPPLPASRWMLCMLVTVVLDRWSSGLLRPHQWDGTILQLLWGKRLGDPTCDADPFLIDTFVGRRVASIYLRNLQTLYSHTVCWSKRVVRMSDFSVENTFLETWNDVSFSPFFCWNDDFFHFQGLNLTQIHGFQPEDMATSQMRWFYVNFHSLF